MIRFPALRSVARRHLPRGRFEVLVNGGLRRVSSVSIQDHTVRLALSSAVSAADEVHARYVLPAELTDPSALRDTDGNLAIRIDMFSFTDVANDTDPGTLLPLTARFVDMPQAHNGEDGFTFRVEFSDSVRVNGGRARDVLDVSAGSVTDGWWLDRHTGLWEFTVLPDSDDDVTVVLADNRACGSPGAPCASGDRRVSNRLEVTIPGPASQPDLEPPGVPTNITLSIEGERSFITWDEPETGGPPDDYLLKFRFDTTTFSSRPVKGERLFEITFVVKTFGAEFSVRVRAENAADHSPWTEEHMFTVP